MQCEVTLEAGSSRVDYRVSPWRTTVGYVVEEMEGKERSNAGRALRIDSCGVVEWVASLMHGAIQGAWTSERVCLVFLHS